MNLMQRFLYKLRMLMTGRYGVDRLSMHMLWFGIALSFLAMIVSSFAINIVSIAIYALAIARILSRNTVKRSAENMFYVTKITKIKKSITHRRNRFKNRKQYRYFKCPNCKSWLRVPRNPGQVKVTCGNCGHQFSYIVKQKQSVLPRSERLI